MNHHEEAVMGIFLTYGAWLLQNWNKAVGGATALIILAVWAVKLIKELRDWKSK